MSTAPGTHVIREFALSGLEGISDETLETHFALYAGYVRALNELDERIGALGASGLQGATERLDLHRRREFEMGGKRLHELYFDNLTRQGGDPDPDGPFARLAARAFGSLQEWRRDVERLSATRGIGWVVAAFERRSRSIVNHWLPVHDMSLLEGAAPLLVMDLWEHAWLLDYGPSERSSHVDAFFRNVRWSIVDERVAACAPVRRS